MTTSPPPAPQGDGKREGRTKKWPTLSGKFSRDIVIWHAQAWAGNPDQHSHSITVAFGWKHEINPTHSHTWPVDETKGKVKALCDLVSDKYLNDLLPFNPTVETLACWLLVRAPAFYNYVEIEAYGGYLVRVERTDIPEAWRKVYLADANVESLTA
jgi:hypothetical protein